MPDLPFTNRELIEKFTNILEHMTHFETDVNEKLTALIEQVTRTNGRVRWLEKMFYMALGGIGILAVIVIPLLLALIQVGKL